MTQPSIRPTIIAGAFVLAAFFCAACHVMADGPADNDAATVRPIPPPGTPLSAEQSQDLKTRCTEVRQAWAKLVQSTDQDSQKGNNNQKAAKRASLAALKSLESEILVFPRAVEMALEFNQFYKPAEFDLAVSLLDEASRRIETAATDPTWSQIVGIGDGKSQTLIIGGYQSKIDGSFQPYAVVIPPGFDQTDARPRRLDLWFHGRGETLTEMSFLGKGRSSAGQYTPADTFVLHPYGRYSNAFKFAGEIDVLESLAYLESRLPVDASRISVRGFSMGGAACWQFATHYPGRFFAANPGAGFSETPEFLKSFQGEDLSGTPEHQRTLWGWYDCPPWSRNLVHCPTVAYSGEIDRQKQAADVMQAALAKQDIDLVHVIGPDTAHKIHPDSQVEIESRMDALARAVSHETPEHIDFTTLTLRYHQMGWIDIQGLGKHWQSANVVADRDDASIDVTTSNVTRIKFDFAPGQWDGDFPTRPVVTIDGNELIGPPVRSDRSWTWELIRGDKAWAAANPDDSDLRKRPGLQGPIDDAFMDSFLFVLPSGQCEDSDLQAWVDAESKHAMSHWRHHFRGDVRQVKDTELTQEQIDSNHLILFGDPMSNSVIGKISEQLPIGWTQDTIRGTRKTYGRRGNALVMIYPNPLNPNRYVVINSGFTFREYDYLNNARQTPKLPDWAIIDITGGATMRDPGKVLSTGFFDEQWQVAK
ncbi:prolyl oligopeptidase family serine peptidase [Stieleria varia]|uniref:Prolyl oligopeptidase family protein n=1 Tax=Stieleria varia TaxID=2528005 RepID=A0A5C6A8K1_9BACT|nr:prolyl oligopeptidase family serine peptidase [Stieleria varia]TWT94613.1 Prolyl oligopeptidase family protein [Stieleria varia]